MEFFVGLDVPLLACALCIVAERGKICLERKLQCVVDDIAHSLNDFGFAE